jgi:hypothetical protein
MNRILQAMLLVTVALACSKDEEPTITVFKFGATKEIKVSKGYISDCGFNDFYDTQDFKITFPDSGSGISLNQNKDLTGKGNIIIIHLNSTSTSEIVPGIYTSSINENDNSFNAGVITNKDFSLEISGTASVANSGTVEVSKSGGIYTIVVNIIKDGNPLITGTYTGKLTMANCY